MARRRPARDNVRVTENREQEHIQYHRDGTVGPRGRQSTMSLRGTYWEWFRKDGTIMRSGVFTAEQQTGEWTTYNREGIPQGHPHEAAGCRLRDGVPGHSMTLLRAAGTLRGR